jgi:hypothetical protein
LRKGTSSAELPRLCAIDWINGSRRSSKQAPEGNWRVTATMQNFLGGDVVYTPEVIEIMSAALEASIESLPEPVSATQVHTLAESILHSAGRGERDIAVLERIALVELRITPRA